MPRLSIPRIFPRLVSATTYFGDCPAACSNRAPQETAAAEAPRKNWRRLTYCAMILRSEVIRRNSPGPQLPRCSLSVKVQMNLVEYGTNYKNNSSDLRSWQ